MSADRNESILIAENRLLREINSELLTACKSVVNFDWGNPAASIDEFLMSCSAAIAKAEEAQS